MFLTTSTLFFHIDNSFQVSNKINNTIIVYITKNYYKKQIEEDKYKRTIILHRSFINTLKYKVRTEKSYRVELCTISINFEIFNGLLHDFRVLKVLILSHMLNQ